ncbi:unnamed protein product [Ilex paraguariensis]|uniref:Uncharacterized protein n=1 Tax=Ilex paraguariensis TaxID=185542 RepID=A0ABC8TXW5_9AQUA
MVFNGVLVVSVANISADMWQYIACIHERISSEQLLDLAICFPLQQLGRLALCLWTFLCVLPSSSTADSYYSSDSDDSDSSSSSPHYNHHHDRDYYDSHSD